LEAAQKHLGERYLWGGRSLYDPHEKTVLTGVDCSGLVNWSFRQVGWFVPRDAHEQYMKARPLSPDELKPADLIFLAKIDKPEKIVHVAFYAGNGELIEAPQSGEAVRKISFKDRFGIDFKEAKSKMTVGDRILYFGTLFTEGS
jgi:cell wall-associated NlpC family hydrolase